MDRNVGLLAVVACCFITSFVCAARAQDAAVEVRFRRPVALALSADESFLLVANRDSGTLSKVDVESLQVVGEFQVGSRISDITRLSKELFLLTDSSQHQLVCFAMTERGPEVRWKKQVPSYPVAVESNRESTTVAVAGRWSRQIGLIRVTDQAKPEGEQSLRTVDLSFVPGHLCWIDATHLLVGDAFGDNLCMIDANGTARPIDWISGHRIGGMGLSADRQTVLIAEQVLNHLARSTRNDVHWGLMVANQLRQVPCDKLFEKKDKVHSWSTSQPIGGPQDAKGDPGAVAVCGNGLTVVALGGVDQVAFAKPDEIGFAFVDVGRRPIDLVCTSDGRLSFVANTLDDSVSVVDLESMKSVATVSLGPIPDRSLVQRGERLFFDARLSHDGWMSCHSCHVDGHTNGMLNDNLSDQKFGNAKRVLSLLGHSDTAPLAWNGSSETLEAQIRNSIMVTMQSDEPPQESQVEALAAFVHSLPAPPSIVGARGNLDHQKIQRGQELFQSLNCSECHRPPTYTSPEVYNVGIQDEKGIKEFNPPSLVGLGQRDHFFHDNRANSLRQVFVEFRHELRRDLTAKETSELISFLRSL